MLLFDRRRGHFIALQAISLHAGRALRGRCCGAAGRATAAKADQRGPIRRGRIDQFASAGFGKAVRAQFRQYPAWTVTAFEARTHKHLAEARIVLKIFRLQFGQRGVIHALPAALVSLAHDGPKVYADRFELLYRREASRPNEMWQARSYSA